MKKILKKSYHDWNLMGITSYGELKILEFSVGFKDHRSKIKFHGVKKSRIDNFLMGNIILDFSIYHGTKYKENLMKSESFESLFYMPQQKAFHKKFIKSILDEELMFIQLNSSYGCVAVIICETVEEIEIE